MRLMLFAALLSALTACQLHSPTQPSLLHNRPVHIEREHDFTLQHQGQTVYILLSEDKMHAEIFAPHLPHTVLESVKGGYIDTDNRIRLQRHENGWKLIQTQP